MQIRPLCPVLVDGEPRPVLRLDALANAGLSRPDAAATLAGGALT